MSLRGRLLVATAVAVLCGLLVVDAITYSLVTRSQIGQVDAALERAHPPTEQLAATGQPESWALIPEIAPGLLVVIIDQQGDTAFSTPAKNPGEAPITINVAAVDLARQAQTVPATDGGDMRLRIDEIRGGGTLIVGESLHEVTETKDRLLGVLLTASAVAIAAVLAIAWWLIRVGLAPLRAVESSAAMMTDDALSEHRVPGADQQTEVGSLALAINAMLDRLDDARAEREQTLEQLRASEARMRQFVADASHELRTPVAATAAYAELFDKGARDRPADLERSMSGIRSETARMGQLVDDLLLLARLDEQRPLAVERVDLTEIVLSAIDAARVLQPERVFKLRVDDVVAVDGDPTRLRQVVDNILTNVRLHTPVEAPCEITLSTDGTGALLSIRDRGSGVDDAQLERLGDRFFRVDDTRTRGTGGSGLGLSIADAIVHAHGGSIVLSHNDPHGLAVEVHIPRSDDPNPDSHPPA